MAKVRAYCFTLNNPTSNEIPIHESERFIIWQREVGESGTPHLQGYIELTKPTRINNMASWLRGAHFEPRAGTREQAKAYCEKEDSRVEGPWSRGGWDLGGAGTRTDLNTIKRKLDEGVAESAIADEHFGEWLRYYKGFREYKKLRTGHRNWKTEVNILWGESGTGKSRTCQEKAPSAYWKTRDEWWDAYDGEEDIIIDDFYGWLPYDFLLRLMDRYPLDVPTKGGFRRFVGKRLFITSNKQPEEWYPNVSDKTPLLRRIDNRTHFNTKL